MFRRAYLTGILASAGLMWTVSGCRPSDITAPEAGIRASSLTIHSSSAMASVQRPFKADLRGVVTFGPREPGQCRTMDFPFMTGSTGTGQAAHLGRVEYTALHCFEQPVGPPPPYGLMERGQMTLVAANGDELRFSYEGEQITPVFANPTLVTSELIITGGTGRFADATGWAHGNIEAEVPADPDAPWPARFVMEGQISY